MSIYILSQTKAHLTNFKSNALEYIMKINVLFEIHALVSRISVFDEIRESPYLRKSPCSTLFEPKLNLINLVPFNFISLSSIQSFETNLSLFCH